MEKFPCRLQRLLSINPPKMERLRSREHHQNVAGLRKKFKKLRRQYGAAARSGEEFPPDQFREMLELDAELEATDDEWYRNYDETLMNESQNITVKYYIGIC